MVPAGTAYRAPGMTLARAAPNGSEAGPVRRFRDAV